MYEHGAKDFFDIASVMAYGLWTDADDHRIAPERTNFPRLILTRRLMEAWGDGAKPIWVSEFGWNALPAGWQGDPSPWGSFSVAEQRPLDGARAGASAGRVAVRRRHGAVGAPHSGRPSRRPDRVLRAARRRLAAAPLVRPAMRAASAVAALGPGWHEESHEDILIEGAGQHTLDPVASGQRYWESPIAGTTLRLTFRGTDVVLLAPVGAGTWYRRSDH